MQKARKEQKRKQTLMMQAQCTMRTQKNLQSNEIESYNAMTMYKLKKKEFKRTILRQCRYDEKEGCLCVCIHVCVSVKGEKL